MVTRHAVKSNSHTPAKRTSDVHPSKGRSRGKIKSNLFRHEHTALNPRELERFDADVQTLTGTPGDVT